MSSAKKLLEAAAGNAGGAGLDVAEVFSTFLYTGNGSNQTITNGIDLDGEGGLVWVKKRSTGASHGLYDTERGVNKFLISENTNAQATYSGVNAFYSSGFRLGSGGEFNQSSQKFASWTFRKAEKFFDIVTYTGNGTSGRGIAHNLGSVPGMIIVKRTDGADGWVVYHRERGNTKYLQLNSAGAEASALGAWNNTSPTSTVFTVGNAGTTNEASNTYVAYLFAHNDDDGDFGPDGDQDIISCGSFTTNSSGNALVGPDLGWEPQWVLLKNATSSASGNWWMFDSMRGFTASIGGSGGGSAYLNADLSSGELKFDGATVNITSNGFTMPSDAFATGQTFIYMAIRAPMITEPEAATEVFDVTAYTGNGSANRTNGGLLLDMNMLRTRAGGSVTSSRSFYVFDRTRGAAPTLITNQTNAAETNYSGTYYNMDQMQGFSNGSNTSYFNNSSYPYISYIWKRAKGYFDVVAYRGNGTAGRTVAHNLGVAPEMMWIKNREDGPAYSSSWGVYHGDNTNYLLLNENQVTNDDVSFWNDTSPTSSVFTVGTQAITNKNNTEFIAYLFATLAGISKVGSVSHSGSSTNVDCGFSNGARFVMLKRTDGAGNWYVWDSARGIIAGSDPYLLLDTNAQEITNTDYIDPLSSGFTITGDFTDGTYIFYAIA